MGGGALQPQILPIVLPARRVGRHDGEGMKRHRQVMLGRRRPHRLDVRVIQRHARRRVDQNPPGPARFSPTLYLGEAALDVAGGDQDDAADALGVRAAVILHPPVIGAVHADLQADVIAKGHGPAIDLEYKLDPLAETGLGAKAEGDGYGRRQHRSGQQRSGVNTARHFAAPGIRRPSS